MKVSQPIEANQRNQQDTHPKIHTSKRQQNLSKFRTHRFWNVVDRSADPQVRRAGKVLNRQDRLASLAVVFEMVLDIAQAKTNQPVRAKSNLVDGLGLYHGTH